MAEVTERAPARLAVGGAARASFVIALLGSVISAYLTVEHFTTSATLACPETGAINCQKVTTSAWSHLGPVPVAVLGLAYFVGMAVLCSPPAWRVRALSPLRTGGAVVGVLTALCLVWVELFQVDAICLWCTAVHVCALGLLITVLWASSAPSGDR
jgi:uncharacterized membrane protein